MFYCRCVKTNSRFEIQYVMNTNKFNPHWVTYDPYVANSWDSLVSLIMQRKRTKFCCETSQKQFDFVTNKMLECSNKGYQIAIS
jgi:hypothetical protein